MAAMTRSETPAPHPPQEMPPLPAAPPAGTKALIAIFLVLTAAIAAAGYGLFAYQKNTIVAEKQRELARIAQVKSREIDDWRKERIDDAKALAQNEAFVDVVGNWLAGRGSSAAEGYIRGELDSRLVSPRYESIFVLDREGRVRLSVGASPDNTARFPRLAAKTLDARRPLFTDFRQTATRIRPVRFNLLAPLIATDHEGAKVVGILGYQIDPYSYFYRLIAPWPTPSPTAEVLLVRREGRQVLFLSQLRHLPGTEFLEMPANTPGLVAAKAEHSNGAISGTDYRGMPVIAVARPIPGTPWSLLAKIDQAEALAPVKQLALWVTGVAILAVVVAAALLAVWWRKEQARHQARHFEDALQRQALTEHFDYLAKYANDIILLADSSRRLVEVNDRAVEAYGYPRERLLQMSWEDLAVSDSRPGFEILWDKTKDASAVVYEAEHIRADGSRFPAEVSARVIEARGRTFYQAIIRDITERKAAERKILRLSNMYAALSQTNQAIVRMTNRDELFAEMCRIAVEFGHFRGTWIGLLDDTAGEVVSAVYCGEHPEFFRGRRVPIHPDAPAGAGPTGTAVREARLSVSNDFLSDPTTGHWHDIARHYGVHSSAALPLKQGDSVIGVMSVYAAEKNYFDEEVVALLQEMTLDISYALDNLQREERRRQTEHTLKESEERFRQLFDNMSNGVAVFEPSADGDDFVFKNVNRSLERIEHVRKEELIGRKVTEAFPGVRAFGLWDVLWRVWRSGEPEHMGATLYRDERISGWRENDIYRLPSGEVVCVYADVTQRKEAEDALRENEERLSLVLQGSNDGFWDYDLRTGAVYYSPRWAEMLGYNLSEIDAGAHAWRDRVHPDDLSRAEEELDAHLKGKTEHYHSEFRMHTKSGDWKWILARGMAVERDDEGKPLRIAGTHTDITERKEAEEQLRLWAMVFEGSGESIFITDAQRKIVSANRAFYETTGYTPEEVIGKDPAILSSHQHDRAFYQNMWAAINEVGHWQGEIWDRRKDGEVFPEWLAITAARDPQGHITNYIAIFSDISERKAAEERIRFLAQHDFLTGLPNRMLLQDRLSQELAHARRSGRHIAVLFVDLDRFKNVNDSLGHHLGDRLLMQVAERLSSCVRIDDTVSRQGGDEFIIALTDIRGPDDAAHVAQKVLDEVSQPFQLDGVEVHITPSVGISLYPEDGRDIDTLVRNADAAMYHAKDQGRNNFQFFVDELSTRARARLSLENSLRRALLANEFFLLYQPQINARTGELIGAEALIRWRRTDSTMLPAEFIPLAEESGLILAIGEWVLREACRQQRAWSENGLPAIPVAVNISAIQFHQHQFLDLVGQIMAETGADPTCIEMELTEGIIMQEADTTIGRLRQIKEMGMSLAIDDFGTGYSSLSYLRRFPLDRLKVDQSFVRDMEYDSADLAITEAIIGLARTLGLRVIAEGVETEREIMLLRERQCEDIQGNFFAPPLPPDEFLAWYRRGRQRSAGA